MTVTRVASVPVVAAAPAVAYDSPEDAQGLARFCMRVGLPHDARERSAR